LAYYGIDNPAEIDFEDLWGSRTDTMAVAVAGAFGNRSDNGELLFLDMKSLDEGGDGPTESCRGQQVRVSRRWCEP